jgi:hypothetical protein
MAFLEWTQSTPLAAWVRESMWGYPFVLTSHAIGMAAVVGMVLMINLRVLGFAPKIPIPAMGRLFTVARAGVALNVLSGICLFTADAVRFTENRAFQVKMALILAGAVSVWLLLKAVANEGVEDAPVTAKAKVIAGLSIVFWLGAITAGRLTAYVS